MEPTPPRSQPTPIRTVLDDTARLREDAEVLSRHAGTAIDGWRRYLAARLETHPYATVTLAAGVGWILGGGVPRPLLSMAFAVGSRIAADRIVSGLTRAATVTRSDD